jgi:hypothetical protein
MKIIKKANGDNSLLITKSEWLKIGKNQGWIKTAGYGSMISTFVEEAENEMKSIRTLARDIAYMEQEISEKAKSYPDISEGDDYYGDDYLSQLLNPELKASISDMLNYDSALQIADVEYVLGTYSKALETIARDMKLPSKDKYII